MKRVFAVLALAGLLAAACGGAGTPVAVATTAAPTLSRAPTASPAPTPTTKTMVFTTDLLGANEVPAIADAEQSCTGTATVTLNVTMDPAAKITAATAKFEFSVKSCPTTTNLILSHIHQGAAGANGGVKVDSGMTAAAPIALTTGGTTFTKDNITVTDLQVATDLVANPAGFYYNVHSMVHPLGVVRGQLKLKT